MSTETEKLASLVKQEVEFLKEKDAIDNVQSGYFYQSKCGNHLLKLDYYLLSYKEWLIEKGYVIEKD